MRAQTSGSAYPCRRAADTGARTSGSAHAFLRAADTRARTSSGANASCAPPIRAPAPPDRPTPFCAPPICAPASPDRPTPFCSPPTCAPVPPCCPHPFCPPPTCAPALRGRQSDGAALPNAYSPSRASSTAAAPHQPQTAPETPPEPAELIHVCIRGPVQHNHDTPAILACALPPAGNRPSQYRQLRRGPAVTFPPASRANPASNPHPTPPSRAARPPPRAP